MLLDITADVTTELASYRLFVCLGGGGRFTPFLLYFNHISSATILAHKTFAGIFVHSFVHFCLRPGILLGQSNLI